MPLENGIISKTSSAQASYAALRNQQLDSGALHHQKTSSSIHIQRPRSASHPAHFWDQHGHYHSTITRRGIWLLLFFLVCLIDYPFAVWLEVVLFHFVFCKYLSFWDFFLFNLFPWASFCLFFLFCSIYLCFLFHCLSFLPLPFIVFYWSSLFPQLLLEIKLSSK